MATNVVSQLQLAPLGAGDLIDRTVRLYRRNLTALIRASAPPVVVSALGAVAWSSGVRAISLTDAGDRLAAYMVVTIIGILLWVAGNLLHLVVMGGASRNLVMHLLWDEPVSARAIYRAVRSRFFGLLGATISVGVMVIICAGVAFVGWYLVILLTVLFAVWMTHQTGASWLMAVLGIVISAASFVGALYLFFLLAGRLAYVPQVMLVEGKGVFASVARSAQLSRGNVRRLMAMFMFTTFTTYSALMLLLLPLGWFGYLNGIDPSSLNPFSPSQTDWPVWYAIGYQVVAQLSTILLAPVWMLGLSLLYVDERVRHEGYDLELQAARAFGEMPALPGGTLTPLAPAISDAPAKSDDLPPGGAGSFGGSVLGLNR
ncbi:MAG TPA: hypothetical protein VGV59_21125 [Pyrinomonadaceae bacterium]|nr:hypothetical protein [Pyrinomonadaceae bacterium]